VTGPVKAGPGLVGPDMIRAFAASEYRPMGHELLLAGWSRELSANQWQPVRNAAGTPEDRNVILS
jgi:hypothetical protein